MTEQQVISLIQNLESDRIERTISFQERKLGPLVCALSNDFSATRQPGYILLGVNDDGSPGGLTIGDKELQQIGGVKTNGNVLPQPSLTVSPVFNLKGGDVVVVEVLPSLYPLVRYDGICWIRIGPRMSKASPEEERILTERRASFAKTYDLVPALGSTIEDFGIELFKSIYLPLAVDKDILAENGRSVKEQLASLRFFDPAQECPTNAGILLFGANPVRYLPGAYIQYIKFSGEDMSSDVNFEKVFNSALITGLNQLDDFIKLNIIKERPVRKDSFKEDTLRDYPYWALRELIMNAIMHRNYDSNAPVYIYHFSNRIEIVNPGGLYGEATPQNFPNASDYRNIVIAEAMKILGYVNRFNYGIKRATEELIKNGNGEPAFDLTLVTKFKVTIYISKHW